MAVKINGRRLGNGEESRECGDWAGCRGTGQPNLSHQTKLSDGANGGRETFFVFPVQLTTNRIDKQPYRLMPILCVFSSY